MLTMACFQDLPGSIRRVAKFLGKELTQQQMERLCDHLSFENFKNNKSVNFEELREVGWLDEKETFIRKGFYPLYQSILSIPSQIIIRCLIPDFVHFIIRTQACDFKLCTAPAPTSFGAFVMLFLESFQLEFLVKSGYFL